jgi:hypothetical protein
MRRIADRRPRFGNPRTHRLLQTLGWRVNHKRVERIWREENGSVRQGAHLGFSRSWLWSDFFRGHGPERNRTLNGRSGLLVLIVAVHVGQAVHVG